MKRLEYSCTAGEDLRLQVSFDGGKNESEELMRLVVGEASTFIGVLAAGEPTPAERRAA